MSTSSPIQLRRPWKLALMLGVCGLVSIGLSDVFTRLTFESLAPTRYIPTSRSSNEKAVVKPLSLSSLLPDSWVDALESAERWLIRLSGGGMLLYDTWLLVLPKRMARCPACGEDILLLEDPEFSCADCKADLRIDATTLALKSAGP